MNSPAVKDLSAIPPLAADDPVIIAFSARRDLCADWKQPAPPSASTEQAGKLKTFVLIGVVEEGREDLIAKAAALLQKL